MAHGDLADDRDQGEDDDQPADAEEPAVTDRFAEAPERDVARQGGAVRQPGDQRAEDDDLRLDRHDLGQRHPSAGNLPVSSRPPMASAIWSRFISPRRAVRTIRPVRMTVIRSAISTIRFSGPEMSAARARGSSGDVEPVEQLAPARLHGLAVEQEPAFEPMSQEDAFAHGKTDGEVEFLIDQRIPALFHLARLAEDDRLAVELAGAAGRALVARHDLHRRRPSGTVLADQSVDLAGDQFDVDVVEHLRRSEAVPHASQCQDRTPGIRDMRHAFRRLGGNRRARLRVPA